MISFFCIVIGLSLALFLAGYLRADLVQNTALIAIDSTSNPQTTPGLCGEAVNVGMPLYQTNASNGYWFKGAATNSLLSGGSTKAGIAFSTTAALGQAVQVFTYGRINLGATLTVGQTYVISHNTGNIAPISDLTTNDFVTILGVAVNTGYIQTPQGAIFPANVAKA